MSDITDITLDLIKDLQLDNHHETKIFPPDSNAYIQFTAGNVANQFGDWIEIKDNNEVSLSTVFADCEGAFSGILLENFSVIDKIYILEVGYGDGTIEGTINVMRHRFSTGDTDKKVPAVNYVRINALMVPSGSTLYYRMKCETASANCEASFRYHYHEHCE